jgi:hypothetical protein
MLRGVDMSWLRTLYYLNNGEARCASGATLVQLTRESQSLFERHTRALESLAAHMEVVARDSMMLLARLVVAVENRSPP